MAELETKTRNNNTEIYAPLKDKWLVLTPEEIVRQKTICRLVNIYGYSLNQMEQELKVSNSKRGQGKARADIVLWKTEEDRKARKGAFIVVECKAENVKIQKGDYFQGLNYATWAKAKFFVTTNEKEIKFFKILEDVIPDIIDEIVDIPQAKDINNDKKINELLQQTKKFTREEFQNLLFACHNVIRDNDKLSPEMAFDEISKILFMKIRHERQKEAVIFSEQKFLELKKSNQEINPDDSKPFYQYLFELTKKAFEKDEIFDKNDALKIRETSFIQIVRLLQKYNLSDTSDDVKGIAFEEFLGKTFRGDLGQFFTPRTIVDFMVSILDPQESELVCDPCCGTGGFLIKTFEYVREKIEQDIQKTKEKIRNELLTDNFEDFNEKEQNKILAQVNYIFSKLNLELETNHLNSRLHQLSYRCIYGTDAEPRSARTAKMNMIMHGDGHGGVHHHDGLLNINGIFENRFDIIITNPPFGSKISKELEITDTDRYKDQVKIENYTKIFGDEYIQALKQVSDNIGKPLLELFELGKINPLTEIIFLERCLKLLKKGGRLGIVLPEGTMNNTRDFEKKARDFFEGKAKLLLITSIPQDVFIAAGATVKPSLLFMRKFTEQDELDYQQITLQSTTETNEKYAPEIEQANTKFLLIENCLELLQDKQLNLKKAFKARENNKASIKSELDLLAVEITQCKKAVVLGKKELKTTLASIENLKQQEIKTLIKQKFNYTIPIAEVENTSVGNDAKGENELDRLTKEFKKYRQVNQLWQDNYQTIDYEIVENEIVRKLSNQQIQKFYE